MWQPDKDSLTPLRDAQHKIGMQQLELDAQKLQIERLRDGIHRALKDIVNIRGPFCPTCGGGEIGIGHTNECQIGKVEKDLRLVLWGGAKQW